MVTIVWFCAVGCRNRTWNAKHILFFVEATQGNIKGIQRKYRRGVPLSCRFEYFRFNAIAPVEWLDVYGTDRCASVRNRAACAWSAGIVGWRTPALNWDHHCIQALSGCRYSYVRYHRVRYYDGQFRYKLNNQSFFYIHRQSGMILECLNYLL